MTRKTNRLELLQIPKPCPSDWEKMMGDDRKRFCIACHKYVYNLSAMSRREAEALIEDSQGKVCARFTRLADGQVITHEPPIILHHINRRPSPIAAAIVTAMLSLSPAIAAPQPSQINNQAVSQTETSGPKNPIDSQGSMARFHGTVLDAYKAVIAGAKVTLIEDTALTEQTTTTSNEGTFYFETVKAGFYSLRVEAPGFANSETRGITLNANQSQEIELTLSTMRMEVTAGIVEAASYPLRELYTKSDRVIIARIGESVVVETAGESKTLMTTLNVSSTLKGSDHKTTAYVYHSIYGDEQRLFKPGENVLLFLTQREKQKKQKPGYELFDSVRGVKKLSDDDLKAYTRHINELANFLKDGKLENAELVEWLVRCAEDNATRWEGAMELASSVRSLRELQEEQESEEEGDEAEESDSQVSSAAEPAAEEPTETDEGAELATKLSDAQKERLVKAFLRLEKFNEGDLELLEVVSFFKDSRLVPFLMSHLHGVESAPPRYAESLMNTLAEFLNDETITEAVEKYSDEVSYDDLEDEGNSSAEADEEITVDEASEKKVAIEQRSQMLKQFLVLVEQKLSQPTSLN